MPIDISSCVVDYASENGHRPSWLLSALISVTIPHILDGSIKWAVFHSVLMIRNSHADPVWHRGTTA
jgi:hypothetical protein